MSFSLEVKKEICDNILLSGGQQALLCATILSAGSLVKSGGGLTFIMSSENSFFIDFAKLLLRSMYPQSKLEESTANVNFKQKTRSEITVDSDSGRQILTDLGILSFSKEGNYVINHTGAGHLIIEEQDKIEFLKGMFLGCGSVSIPLAVDVTNLSKSVKNSGYHFEWNVQSNSQAILISQLLAEFEILSKIVERNDSYVVYLKEAESISQILGLFGASKAVLKLENERAGRQMRNLINRQANCISANIDKSIGTALKQLEAIETIRQTIGLESLPEPLMEVALARLANPEGSLVDIGECLSSKISKGALSGRFKKLIQIAEDIKN